MSSFPLPRKPLSEPSSAPARPKRVRLALEVLDQRMLLSSNPIVVENLLPGNPASEWQIDTAGDLDIQGFATQISVDQGQTVHFKVDTPATDYRLDIYRMGYYSGMGARKVATIQPSAALPQIQPEPLSDWDTGLVDAGNWAVSASWAVPVNATSGIYFAKLVREDGTPGSSHIFFVVRDDDGHSDLLFQTSDTTWQAYNTWGGRSLYDITSGGQRAYKVSYNRPVTTRRIDGGMGETNFVFWAEYPMVRWLEANGYHVSYFTNVDTARYGAEILDHKAFLSVGHDEYWSGEMRANVEAAREAGVHLAFFSGNEVYWKTRWETSIDASGTPYRTLVCYKESPENAKIDPMPDVWTGMWRDERFLPDDAEPEQTLMGQIFSVNRGAIYPGTSMQVPAEDGKLRFWRNTSVANLPPGQVALVGDKVLGYEWDEDVDNGYRPAGIIRMSSTTEYVPEKLVDPISWPGCGGIPGVPCSTCRGCQVAPGFATHTLTMYRAPSGALVFGAGTVQYSWGLDGNHDGGFSNPSLPMRQATVNLFADMGIQPATLQSDLVPATASTDTTPPTSTITFPATGFIVQDGSTPVLITGTASDVGGVVGGVEVSTDGGLTWRRADGRANWSYLWTPTGNGPVTLRSRAADDSLRTETPTTGVTVTVQPDESTPPQLYNVAASIVSNQSVTIAWVSDEESTSRVRYGTNPSNLSGDSQDPALVLSHSRALTGLTPNTTYYYQVTSVDEFGNSSTSQTFSFTTPAFLDTTAADFAAGTVLNASVIETGNGEVTLAPSAGAEFFGTALPAGWSSVAWGGGGGATVAGGAVNVNGARVSTNGLFSPGRSLEFTGTFSAVAFQNVGLSNDLTGAPWAIFTTGSGGALIASTRAAGATTSTDTVVPGSWLNAPHRFRIDWTPSSVTYFVDGTQLVFHPLALTAPMRPVISDFTVDAQALSVNWVRLAPYAGSGTYTSRVFDAGSSVRWLASWNAATPAGTSVAMSLRMGDTPTPDAAWTDFIAVSSGAPTGGKSRYVQYRATLTTNDGAVTPTLPEVSLSYTTAPDTTSPTLAARTPTPNAINVDPFANIVLGFDELMNGGTISTSTVRLRAVDGSQDVAATVVSAGSTVTLAPAAGLSGNRTYRVTVSGSVADTSGNTLGSEQSWTFTTGPRQVTDGTAANFNLGSFNGTYLTHTGNGEIILAPVAGSEFSGASVPAGWTAAPWGSGGTTSLANDAISLNGTRLWTESLYGPGRTLEFVATLTGAPYQHVGLTQDFSNHWAIFSTGTGGELFARTNGGTSLNTPIAGNWLGAPHRYRIDWTETSVDYFIDGAPVASHAIGITTAMRPAASDFADGGDSVVLDWMRLTPYVPTGTFQSRVFDAGQVVGWNVATWNAFVPTGTDVLLSVRMGNSPTPDSTWTGFVPLAGSGSVIGGSSRYLQYQATLTSGTSTTPILDDVTITYNIPPVPGDPPGSIDSVAPRILASTPAGGAVEVMPTSTVVVSFTELMNPATIALTSVRLRQQGAVSDVPATLTFSGATATLTPDLPLIGNRTYQVTVTSAVSDLAGNTLAAQETWSFVTQAPHFRDTTTADFIVGTTLNTVQATADDGEIILSSAVSSDFSGSALSAGWTTTPWNAGGGSTVSGGAVVVNGAMVQAPAQAVAGQSLEFVATFGGDSYQHAGLADFSGSRWAIFSTGAAGGALYARTSGGGVTDTLLPGSLLNVPHRFRIDWSATDVRYFIDGTQLAVHTFSPSGALSPIISDFNSGGNGVSADWMRLSPYSSSGEFSSRIFDGGQSVLWQSLAWTGLTPAGTDLGLSYRMGNTPLPDNSWTHFVPAVNGTTFGGASRYFQYRATLTTNQLASTPSLNDVIVKYDLAPDATPPAIGVRSPAAGITGVGIYSAINVTFNELMNAGTITTAALSLRAEGASSDVPATLSYSGSTATLTPNTPLATNTTYVVTVSDAIADAAGNLLGNGLSMLSWSFTTGVGQFTQTSTSDFASGTNAGTDVTATAGGEIGLGILFSDDFGGDTLNSSRWTIQAYTTPSVTVTTGQVAVSGAALWSTQAIAGSPISGRVSFGPAPYQYFGLATSLDSFTGNYWAAFSTGGTTDTLFARVNVSGATYETNLGLLPTGFHDYHIAHGAGGFGFYVDGALRTTVAASFPAEVAPKLVLSSYNAAPQPAISADSLRFDSFTPTGLYTSAIIDAQTLVNWTRADWSALLPAGTSVALEARTTNAVVAGSDKLVVSGTGQVLDGYGSETWSAWTPVTNGGDLTNLLSDSRYLQYRAVFSTNDSKFSAAITDIAFSWL